jgi:NADPH-dependent ferric siderophore reductase
MVMVQSVERVTPKCVRVTLGGPELEGFTTHGAAEHLKVLFARPGEARIAIPEWGPEGPILAEGQQMPPSRTYTPRFWRPESLELVIDFMLHGEGLASNWARNVKAGDEAAISGQPGGPYVIDESADWFLIAGDESALPGLSTILEALPATAKAKVFVEVEDSSEEQALRSEASIDITWLHRKADAASGSGLESAIRAVQMPQSKNRVWVGCEAAVMRNIRRHLLFDRGMDRGDIHTHGYWKLGETNHPDHDVGQDI